VVVVGVDGWGGYDNNREMFSAYNRMRGRDMTSGLFLTLADMKVVLPPGEEWLLLECSPQDPRTTTAITTMVMSGYPFTPTILPDYISEVRTSIDR